MHGRDWEWISPPMGILTIWPRLTMGPTWFTNCWSMWWECSDGVIWCLNFIFLERVLTNNDPAFSSWSFRAFAESWGMYLHFRCTYAPSGNSIVEQSHGSTKRIAARKQCIGTRSCQKMMSMAHISLANALYWFEVWVKGINRILLVEPKSETGIYEKGDMLVVTWPNKCASRERMGSVTALVSPQAVCVDGVLCNVRDLTLWTILWRMRSLCLRMTKYI